MRQQQRNALAIAAVLALGSSAVAHAAPRGGGAARGAQAANAAAAAGYQAYERRDWPAAVRDAQRAVQLAPKRRDYWLLLANALAAHGQLDEAQEAIARAGQLPGEAAPLARARAQLAGLRAQAAGDAMYKALAAGDVKAAIAHGTEAVRYAPENAGYRLVLVHALLRDGRDADAERVANETIALLPESAAPLALRGYARQGLHRSAEAAADLDRALAQRGVPPAAQRELRLLAADLALAQGQPQRALDLLQPLPADDADAGPRRELAQRSLTVPAAMTGFVLRAPGIDCSKVTASQTCTLLAASAPPVPGYANATAAYRALEEKDYQRALEQARLATQAAPERRDWQLMRMNAALAAHDPREAEQAASAALALGSDPVVLAQRSTIRRQLGDVTGANADAEAALAAGTLPPQTRAGLLADLGRQREAREVLASAPAATANQRPIDLAYLSSRIGDSEAARQAFARADAAGQLPPNALLDAGYAAMHSKHDPEAVGYFKRAIDAVNGLQLKMTPQMVYDTRRTVADLTRKWGVLASVTLRNGAGVTPGFGAVGGGSPGRRTTQAGVEAYYRPWGWRNGQFVELFARGFMTLSSQNGGFTGGDSFQGGVGVRWKPLSTQNLLLSFSRVFGPNVNDDWLAQVGYSYDVGNDLRVDRRSWWTTRFYAEAGRYLQNQTNYGIVSLMAGRSYLVGGDGRTVVFPHAFIGAEYTSDDPVAKTSAGIGPGVSVRRWFREDVYTAPRSYWDLTVQYRARLTGDDRMRGLYVNGLLNY